MPSNQSENLNSLLTTKRAAQELDLQKCTLEAWRTRGGGPAFIKLGRAVRYRLSDLKAFIESGVRQNTSQV
jgi:hypothetical protein